MTALWNNISTNKLGILVNGAMHVSLLPSWQRFSHLHPLIKWSDYTPYSTSNQALIGFGITEGVRIISNIGLNYLVESFEGRLEQHGWRDEKDKRFIVVSLTTLILCSICLYSMSEHGKNILAKSLAHRVTLITPKLIEDSFLIAAYSHLLKCFHIVLSQPDPNSTK